MMTDSTLASPSTSHSQIFISHTILASLRASVGRVVQSFHKPSQSLPPSGKQASHEAVLGAPPKKYIRVAFVVSGSEVLWEKALSARPLIHEVSGRYAPAAIHMLRLEDDAHTSLLSTSERTTASSLQIEKSEGSGLAVRETTHIANALKEVLDGHVQPSIIVAIGSQCAEPDDGLVTVAQALRAKDIPVISLHVGNHEDGRRVYQTLAHQSRGSFHALESDVEMIPLMAAAGAYGTGDLKALRDLATDAHRPAVARAAQAILSYLPCPSGM